MPPRRAVRARPQWPSNRFILNPLFGTQKLWGSQYQLLLIQAVHTLSHEKTHRLWSRVRRHPHYIASLAQFTPNELGQKYNEIVHDDNLYYTISNPQLPRIIPPSTIVNPNDMVTKPVQQGSANTMQYLHVTQSAPIQPPLYGTRYGYGDSDDEFPDPSEIETKTIFHTNNAGNNRRDKKSKDSSNNNNKSLTLTQLDGIETPGFLHKVEQQTIYALRERLQSTEYHANILRATMDYYTAHPNHHHSPQEQQPLLLSQDNTKLPYPSQQSMSSSPPAAVMSNGLKYYSFPPPPPILHEYLENEEIHDLSLITIDSFLPTIEDEYRFLFQQCFSYYSNRQQPLSLRYHSELYEADITLVQQKLHADGWEGVGYDAHNMNHDHPTTAQMNAILIPKFAPKLASLKTYLNCVIGMPLWYTFIVCNFIYEYHAPQHNSQETIQPDIQIALHQYQRSLLNIIINDFFNRYKTLTNKPNIDNNNNNNNNNSTVDITCKDLHSSVQNIQNSFIIASNSANPANGAKFVAIPSQTNPKERYQAMFTGGGRHHEGVSGFNIYEHSVSSSASATPQQHSPNYTTTHEM